MCSSSAEIAADFTLVFFDLAAFFIALEALAPINSKHHAARPYCISVYS